MWCNLDPILVKQTNCKQTEPNTSLVSSEGNNGALPPRGQEVIRFALLRPLKGEFHQWDFSSSYKILIF